MSKVQTASQLKQLQVRKDKMKTEIEGLQTDKKELNKSINERENKLGAINSQIKDLQTQSAEIIVTEHALLRYFERILGFDLEEIKQQIITPKIEGQIRALKSCKLPFEGHFLIVKGSSIVSIVEKR